MNQKADSSKELDFEPKKTPMLDFEAKKLYLEWACAKEASTKLEKGTIFLALSAAEIIIGKSSA